MLVFPSNISIYKKMKWRVIMPWIEHLDSKNGDLEDFPGEVLFQCEPARPVYGTLAEALGASAHDMLDCYNQPMLLVGAVKYEGLVLLILAEELSSEEEEHTLSAYAISEQEFAQIQQALAEIEHQKQQKRQRNRQRFQLFLKHGLDDESVARRRRELLEQYGLAE